SSEHQLLCDQRRSRLHPPPVHPSTGAQELDHRRASLPNHHHGLPSEAAFCPPKLRSGRAHHDPSSGLHPEHGLLPPPGAQPLPGRSPQFLRDGAADRLSLSRGPTGFQLNALRGLTGFPPFLPLDWAHPHSAPGLLFPSRPPPRLRTGLSTGKSCPVASAMIIRAAPAPKPPCRQPVLSRADTGLRNRWDNLSRT